MSDVQVVTSGDNVAVEVSMGFLSAAPATWDEFVSEYGRGYNYPPPSGLSTSYRTGDDYNIETTLFTTALRDAQKLKARQVGTPFRTLNDTNAFGNTDKFTDSVGGQDYDGTGGSLVDYMIDHYTGLAIVTNPIIGAGSWEESIDDALGTSTLGFSDYFIGNIPQHQHFWEVDVYPRMFNGGLFSTTATIWTSTTSEHNTLQAFRMNVFDFTYAPNNKTVNNRYFLMRKHY